MVVTIGSLQMSCSGKAGLCHCLVFGMTHEYEYCKTRSLSNGNMESKYSLKAQNERLQHRLECQKLCMFSLITEAKSAEQTASGVVQT